VTMAINPGNVKYRMKNTRRFFVGRIFRVLSGLCFGSF
jgi:hypothetical protein